MHCMISEITSLPIPYVVRRTTTLLAVACLAAAMLAAPSNAVAQLPGGDIVLRPLTDKCTWELYQPGSFTTPAFYEPRTPEFCMQFAEDREGEFVGSGDDAWSAAMEPPTEGCGCGQTSTKWLYYPPYATSPNVHPCVGIRHSCSAPGSGCRWYRTGSVTDEEIGTTAECRAKAKECGGPYYGLNAEDEAAQPPEGTCVCGESKTHWYFSTADFENTCKGYKYECLAPLRVKFPRDIGESFRPPRLPRKLPGSLPLPEKRRMP